VTITGTGFHKSPSVTIGGAACTDIAYLSSTQLTCITPAGPAGTADMIVTTPTQEQPSVLAAGYRYYLPFNITAITPDWGMTAGGTTVTLTGTNFSPEVNYQVTLGTALCTDVIVAPDGTSLTCTTGEYQLAAGLTETVVDISLTDGVLTASLPSAYEYLGEIYLRLQTSSEKISFHLTPSVAGAVTSFDHQVTVTTNSHTGYQLSLSALTSSTDLVGVNSTARINTSTGTVSAPLPLAHHSWGFSWASSNTSSGYAASGFDSTYTLETTVENSTSKWAGLPPVGSPTVIRTSTSQCKDGETSELFFGANGDFTLPSDTYTQTILYTAIEN
jgi:hypothetical protein